MSFLMIEQQNPPEARQRRVDRVESGEKGLKKGCKRRGRFGEGEKRERFSGEIMEQVEGILGGVLRHSNSECVVLLTLPQQ
jgi:hypothetical protein